MTLNFKSIVLAACALVSLVAQAQSYPPYPSSSASVYYGVYPVSVEVPYGKTASAPFTYQLQFYVINTTSNTYNLSGYNLIASNAPASNPVTVTGYSDNCGGVLKPSGSTGVCTIFANISVTNPLPPNTPAPINYTFQFGYSAGRPASVQASPPFTVSFATGEQIADAERHVTFINKCTDKDIWFGIGSGAVDAITPDPSVVPADLKSCVDTVNSTDCYPGSVCVNVQQKPTVLNHCFWNNPTPDGYTPQSGAFKLDMYSGSGDPSQTTVTFPVYDNGINTAWNGGFSARVGCSDSATTACTVADCRAGTVTTPSQQASGDACPVGGGFAQPSTLAELTFLGQNPVITANSGAPSADTYDITIINGVTVPTSMSPLVFLKREARATAASDPYNCGTPGALTQTVASGLGGCAWFDKTPPATTDLGNGATYDDFVWVDVGGTDPGDDCVGSPDEGDSCVNGGVCGHTVVGSTVSPTLVCGTQLGYLTADAVCAADKNFGAPFNCASTFNENGGTYNYKEVYGCSTGDFKNSCYSAGASSYCCGCQDWNDVSGPYAGMITIPASTQSCGTISNSNWQALQITPEFLPWLKDLCPTAYVYPYDDASSTFTCQDVNEETNINIVDYVVTFCPTE